MIDADSPTLPPELILSAFDALARQDVVLGPTVDGGYYLIGATVSCRGLLCDVTFPRADTICADTLARADAMRLRAGRTATWFDIDLPSELHRLVVALAEAPPHLAVHTRRALARHECEVRLLAGR